MADLTDYEVRRLEKIKRNAALLQDLGLEHTELSTKRQPTRDGKRPADNNNNNNNNGAKRRNTSQAPSRPTRISARIASVPSKPVYNEDEAQALTTTAPRSRPSRSKKPNGSTSRSSQPVPIETSLARQGRYTAQEVDLLREGWTSWTATEPAPTRDDNGTYHFASHATFTPNKSPWEMLREGVYGGGHYRPLYSKTLDTVIEDDWRDTIPEAEIRKFSADVRRYLVSPAYDAEVNKFGVRCGQTIEEWEAAGWINHEFDVRGWHQWYARFFRGRRCADDERQVGRWERCVGPRGRWRRTLVKKYLQKGVRRVADEGDEEEEISPVLHQTCLHWGWELRQDVLDEIWRTGL